MNNWEAEAAWDSLLAECGSLDAATREQLAAEIEGVAASCKDPQRRDILQRAAQRLRGPHPGS